MNSIIDNITKNDVVAEINLLLNADVLKETIIIIVEGKDDVRFINRMIDEKQITILESYSGKNGAIEILNNYIGEKRVLTILDRDYKEEVNTQIFYYDYCCLEMMLISDLKVFSNLYNDYLYKLKIPADIFRFNMLNELRSVSIVRKVNSDNGLNLNIKAINVNNLLNNSKIEIKELKKTINKTNNDFLKNNTEIENIIDKEYSKKMDIEELLNITNGHDFSNYFAKICRENKKNATQENIEDTLRCSYRKEDFLKTKLFNSLKQYNENLY